MMLMLPRAARHFSDGCAIDSPAVTADAAARRLIRRHLRRCAAAGMLMLMFRHAADAAAILLMFSLLFAATPPMPERRGCSPLSLPRRWRRYAFAVCRR